MTTNGYGIYLCHRMSKRVLDFLEHKYKRDCITNSQSDLTRNVLWRFQVNLPGLGLLQHNMGRSFLFLPEHDFEDEVDGLARLERLQQRVGRRPLRRRRILRVARHAQDLQGQGVMDCS